MPTPISPNKTIKSSSVFFHTRRNYLIWYWSSFAAVTVLVIGLIIQGASIYNKSIDLINEANQKIIEKSGIEIITELNKQDFEQAKQVVLKKKSPLELPPRVRNIFLFNAYVDLSDAKPVEIIQIVE